MKTYHTPDIAGNNNSYDTPEAKSRPDLKLVICSAATESDLDKIKRAKSERVISPEIERLLLQILAAPMPKLIDSQMRSKDRIEWAKAVRSMLRRAKISKVSVTTPNYSMAHSIDISLPSLHFMDHYKTGLDHEMSECYGCRLRGEARRKIEAMVLTAFPDLVDRSETLTDHFDFCFNIH